MAAAKSKDFPSVLAFNGKLRPTEGLMYGCRWEDKDKILDPREKNRSFLAPVEVHDITVRGTMGVAKKSAKSDQPGADLDLKNANIQRVDSAHLPQSCDSLVLTYGLVVLPRAGLPHACDIPSFTGKCETLHKLYREKKGYERLAQLYAGQILSRAPLWRNGYASAVHLHVTEKGKELEEGKDYEPLASYEDHINPQQSNDLIRTVTGQDALAQRLAQTFGADEAFESALLTITCIAQILPGAEIYPSEEFIQKMGSAKKGDKGKTLATHDVIWQDRKLRQAVMHPQKIGNALRQIDSWYPEAETLGPIAVEPLGASQKYYRAFRSGKDGGASFESLLKTMDHIITLAEKGEPDGDLDFFMACTIRGGVQGTAKDSKQEA